MGSRRCVIVLALAGCGEVKSNVDAAPHDGPADAKIFDAPPDSPPDAPPNANIDSALDFPTPNSVVRDFTATEFAGLAMTGTGFNAGGTSNTGNAMAPFAGNIAVISGTQVATFTFQTPIHAAGVSAMDIDFSNDNAVIVKVTGVDTAGGMVASYQRAMLPANSQVEENANALFVGWRTAGSVSTVTVTVDQVNSTGLDNLMFQH